MRRLLFGMVSGESMFLKTEQFLIASACGGWVCIHKWFELEMTLGSIVVLLLSN